MPKDKLSLMDRIGMAFYRCGLCLSQDNPCDKCIENTLKAQGLPISLKKELQNLSDSDEAHAWATYSPFKEKVRELHTAQQKG